METRPRKVSQGGGAAPPRAASYFLGRAEEGVRKLPGGPHGEEAFGVHTPRIAPGKLESSYSDLRMVTEERRVDFWFSDEGFLMVGFKRGKKR